MPRNDSVFLRVKEEIEKDIEKSKLTGSSRLLSEMGYCERLGVSRMTVRKAVDELIRQEKLRRVPGKGIEIVGAAGSRKALFKRLAFVVRFEPEDDFFSRMVLACAQVANSSGYSYNIYNIYEWRSRDVFAEIAKTDIDGVLFTYYIHEQNVHNYELVTGRGIPLVMVDNLPLSGDYPYTLSDDEKGGFLACEHLLSKGHRRILFITDEDEEYTQMKRLEGYRKAVRQRGLPEDCIKILRLKNDGEMEKRVKEEFEKDGSITAIGSFADGYVLEAGRTLKTMGAAVPAKVALMGYGNSVAGRLSEVPLSTIEMPVFEMGVQACRMLIDHLEGRGTLDKRILDVKLLERESTAWTPLKNLE